MPEPGGARRGKKNRSEYVPSWVFEALPAYGLTSTELLVLISIALHRGEQGTCWPSQRRLSEMAGLHRRTLRRAIDALVDKGVLEIIESGDGSRANRYFIEEFAPFVPTQPDYPTVTARYDDDSAGWIAV